MTFKMSVMCSAFNFEISQIPLITFLLELIDKYCKKGLRYTKIIKIKKLNSEKKRC